MPLNKINRRGLMVGAAAMALPLPALALSESQARNYVQRIIDDVLATINLNAPVSEIYRRFGTVFARYADIPTIARLVLGAPWRTLSGNQKAAFAAAYDTYLSSKYARRFSGYRGATITITRSQDAGRKGVLVYSQVQQVGQSAFDLDWQVSDGSGNTKMIDMIIEGISLISSEREEVRALLSQHRGNVDALTAFMRG